jgi:hypothetical protein
MDPAYRHSAKIAEATCRVIEALRFEVGKRQTLMSFVASSPRAAEYLATASPIAISSLRMEGGVPPPILSDSSTLNDVCSFRTNKK